MPSKVSVIDGIDIKPQLLGYQHHIPSSLNFVFFKVVPDNKKQTYFKRIMVCLHQKDGSSSICGHTRFDFCKFFGHVRSHSGDKPFLCEYPDCNAQFALKGNLKRHMESHNETKF